MQRKKEGKEGNEGFSVFQKENWGVPICMQRLGKGKEKEKRGLPSLALSWEDIRSK